MKNKIENISVNELVTTSIVEYGKEVNLNRHIPHVFDGLKPSYRRVILSALDIPNNKLNKTSKIIADTSKYHVHGTDGLKDVAGELVRWGIFDGQGIIGLPKNLDEILGDASPRYTEVKINDTFKNNTKNLLDLVPKFTNELGNIEPEYIPYPLPLLAIYGGMGMGIGCRPIIPAFTKESLLNAYLSNDPYKLEFNYGYKILEGDLKEIWENNSAKFKLSFSYEENEDSITVFGVPELFKISFKNINKLISEGQLQMIDLSSNGINKLLFKRQPNAKKLSIDKLKQVIKKSISQIITFNILVHNNKSVYEICLKDWVDITYKNYIKLLKTNVEKKKSLIEFDINVNKHFLDVAKLLINSNDNYELIAEKLSIDISIVEAIGKKSINTLRNPKNLDNKNNIENLSQLNNFDCEHYIKKVIEK